MFVLLFSQEGSYAEQQRTGIHKSLYTLSVCLHLNTWPWLPFTYSERLWHFKWGMLLYQMWIYISRGRVNHHPKAFWWQWWGLIFRTSQGFSFLHEKWEVDTRERERRFSNRFSFAKFVPFWCDCKQSAKSAEPEVVSAIGTISVTV